MNLLSLKHTCLGLGTLFALTSCGSNGHDGRGFGQQQQAIQNGQIESATTFPAVGQLISVACSPPGDHSFECCTGTVIAPYIVLTAGHCTNPLPSHFKLGLNESDFVSSHQVASAIAHPDRDLGIVILANGSPVRNVQPMVVDTQAKPAIGTDCRSVGFGNHTENGITTRGVKRSATLRVRTDPLSNPNPHDFPAAPLSGNTDFGDSGGPFICNGLIAGVTKDILLGSIPYFSDIDSQWIANVASDYMSEPMLSVVSWGPNRMDAFGRARDGQVAHKTWTGNAWGPAQTAEWETLGGLLVGTPEAVSWGPNRIDTYERGTDLKVYSLLWDGSWGWYTLGPTKMSSHVKAVSWGPGRIDLFALDLDGHLRYKRFDLNDGWWAPPQESEWDSLGGIFADSVTAVSWAPYRLDVFGIGTDQVVYHTAWNGQWVTQTPGFFDMLGAPPGGAVGNISAVSRDAGRLDIFVKGASSGHIFRKKLNYQTWFPSMTGWEDIGAPGTRAVASPSAVAWPLAGFDGYATVYALGSDGQQYRKSFFPDDTTLGWLRVNSNLDSTLTFTGSPVAYRTGSVPQSAFAPQGVLALARSGLQAFHKGYDGDISFSPNYNSNYDLVPCDAPGCFHRHDLLGGSLSW